MIVSKISPVSILSIQYQVNDKLNFDTRIRPVNFDSHVKSHSSFNIVNSGSIGPILAHISTLSILYRVSIVSILSIVTFESNLSILMHNESITSVPKQSVNFVYMSNMAMLKYTYFKYIPTNECRETSVFCAVPQYSSNRRIVLYGQKIIQNQFGWIISSIILLPNFSLSIIFLPSLLSSHFGLLFKFGERRHPYPGTKFSCSTSKNHIIYQADECAILSSISTNSHLEPTSIVLFDNVLSFTT